MRSREQCNAELRGTFDWCMITARSPEEIPPFRTIYSWSDHLQVAMECGHICTVYVPWPSICGAMSSLVTIYTELPDGSGRTIRPKLLTHLNLDPSSAGEQAHAGWRWVSTVAGGCALSECLTHIWCGGFSWHCIVILAFFNPRLVQRRWSWCITNCLPFLKA